MPTAHVLRESEIKDSFRVQQVMGMFDVPDRKTIRHEWEVSLPIEEREWQIGLIIGPSGSGKTTIASELFKTAYIHSVFEWDKSASILDAFPAGTETREIVSVLSSVGLSSPPHWLKPYGHLSNGQRFRVELARLLCSEYKTVVFDEFTSVVDRDVAKICCAALSKTIRRRQRPQLVALSCHFDILDWLQPDWVYEVSSNRFEWRTLRRFPTVSLRVYQTDISTWGIFRGHHYLSADIHRASRCFVATWNEKPVAFTAVLHFPHPGFRNGKREHRTVVLPDYQGLGIGNRLSEFVGEILSAEGFRFFSATSHPAMLNYRIKSPRWRLTRRLGHIGAGGLKSIGINGSRARLTAGFEYLPEKTQADPASERKGRISRMISRSRKARKTKANRAS